MKLSPILAQYLYNNHTLKLSGIGRFLIDPSIKIDSELSRIQKTPDPLNVRFEQDTNLREDPDLIAFISEQTGKMKSLAAADLDSHLELARQFLHIGKPFQFEGIGTLVKIKGGQFEFTPGHLVNEKIKDQYSTQSDPTSTNEDSFTEYEEMFSPRKKSETSPRKLIVLLVALGGLGLAVWGGYSIYKKGASIRKEDTNFVQSATIASDSSSIKKDSVITPPPVTGDGTYRFIIEKSSKQRALSRYRDLKSFYLDVKLETKDSLLYSIFFILPATPADTARIRDSISLLYVNPRIMRGGKAIVEQ